MKLPFPRSYWVEPQRMLAGCYPGDKDPRVADSKLQGLVQGGVTCMVNLMEPGEVSHGGHSFVPYENRLYELARATGQTIHFHRFPIVDRSIPSIADMKQILDCLENALTAGQTPYVHCWGGRGRTGTVIACHLRRTRGLSAADALSRLSELIQHSHDAFWPTPEMPCQHEFVTAWKETI